LTIQTDHVTGALLAVFGLIVLALSGDLPIGTLSFPGAGMMPKLLAGWLIVLGLVLIARGRESPPLKGISWHDLPHALRVTAITALAVALYQPVGFLITMALLLFALIFGVERRQPVAAAAFSLGVVALTYLLFAVVLKTPLEQGLLGF
jgi:hypothetical protein